MNVGHVVMNDDHAVMDVGHVVLACDERRVNVHGDVMNVHPAAMERDLQRTVR